MDFSDWTYYAMLGGGTPHRFCLANDPGLVATMLWSGVAIFVAYTIIGVALLTVKNKGKHENRGIEFIFGLFIFLCGLTHIAGVVTLYWPLYGIQAGIFVATALISSLAAFIVLRRRRNLARRLFNGTE